MQNGYVHIQIDGVLYLAHRLAWLYCRGDDPGEAQIDHRNGVRHDNRLRNLRLAAERETDNLQNLPVRKDCASGHPGVHWSERKGKWQAYIGVAKKLVHLGYFKSKALAVAARKTAKREMHKFQGHERSLQ